MPLIVDHRSQDSKSLLAILREIQDNINEINARSNISLAVLQQGGERLFDSLFVYAKYPDPAGGSSQSKLKMSFNNYIEKQDYPLGIIAYEDKK